MKVPFAKDLEIVCVLGFLKIGVMEIPLQFTVNFRRTVKRTSRRSVNQRCQLPMPPILFYRLKKYTSIFLILIFFNYKV